MIAAVVLLAFAPVHATPTLDELRAQFDQLDCEQVIVGAAALLDDASAPVSAAERQELAFRRGYCLVVIGNVSEAGDVFRSIFESDIDAKAPFEMEPRVRFLADATRADVLGRRQAEAAAKRKKLVERIGLDVTPPAELKGGQRAFFDVKLTDPDGVVRSLRVDFRKRGEPEFYALPVKRQIDGTWRGEIAGTYTRSASGTVLEWFVTASDDTGERLTSHGSREAPRELVIAPGSVMAEDLAANERMGQTTRILATIVAMPIVTAVGAVAGVGAAFGVYAAIAVFAQGAASATLNASISILVAAGGTAGIAAVNFTLLDATDALWATTAGALVFGAGALFTIAAVTKPADFVAMGFTLAGTGTAAVLVGGTVTSLFILNDPPQE